MTERITYSAADDMDAPELPSWVKEDAMSMTYAQAGVDIEEGARAVDAIKGMVHETYRDEVIGDIGGFGGLFSAAKFKDMEDPIMVSGTDGVGTKLQLARVCGKPPHNLNCFRIVCGHNCIDSASARNCGVPITLNGAAEVLRFLEIL